MTVPAVTPFVSYTATGGQTDFPFTFRVDSSAVLVAFVNDVAVSPALYTPILNADQIGSPGGLIRFLVGRAAGDKVAVERESPIQQSAAFTTYGPFPASAVSLSLDDIVMMIQELAALVQRTLIQPRSSAGISGQLPPPVANAVLGWFTPDGGVTWQIANVSLSGGAMVQNEVPTGLVNSTTGSDGNATFVFSHKTTGGTYFNLYVDGVRQPPSRYVLTNGPQATVVFNAGFNPITGSYICADYS